MKIRPKLILTHKIPEEGLRLLYDSVDVVILDDKRPIEVQLRSHLPTADYLITLLSVNITEELLQTAPSLKGIANYAVGYNNIDIAAARKLGIQVTNTPDVLTDSTADLVWALILGVTRRIIEGDRICRANTFQGWLPEFLLGFEVTNKTLGIVGLGRIGTAVAKRAMGFDMRVLYFSRSRKPELEKKYGLIYVNELDILLKQSDIISLNVPYSTDTHHLITKRELSLMKSSAYLINTARGKVVVERDLISALREERIAGAALDVFYDEPTISKELARLKNCVMTPHIGSATFTARNAMAVMVAENILAMIRGATPPQLVPEHRSKSDPV